MDDITKLVDTFIQKNGISAASGVYNIDGGFNREQFIQGLASIMENVHRNAIKQGADFAGARVIEFINTGK